MTEALDARLVAYVRRTAAWIPAGIIGLLMMPFVVTHRSFGPDWTLHLWGVRQQQWNIDAMRHPGLFLSAKPLGAFYPLFAFVGSGVYALGGYLAIVTGPIVAYKLLYLGALCLAYGGFTWLSVQFGLQGWRAQMPGAVLVTATYFVTDMVGRGDFAEFTALSSIPFLIAAICAVVRAPRVRLRHRLAVVVGVFVLTGSHNITLLWGTTFVFALACLTVAAWAPGWDRPWPWRRLAQLIGLGLLGAGLNAWYLFADLAYGLDTKVGAVSQQNRPSTVFVHPWLLLNPFRPADHSPSPVSFFARDVRLSLPVLFFAWAVVVYLVSWRRKDGPGKRLFLGLIAVTGVLVWLLVVESGPWLRLPRAYWSVQFTWRLDGYIVLATVFLVLLTLVKQRSGGAAFVRWTSIVLVAITAFNVGAAVWQVWRVRSEYVTGPYEIPTHGHLAEQVVAAHHVTPKSWYPSGDFRDVSSPVVAVAAQRSLTVPLDQIHGSTFRGWLPVPDGAEPFTTNIAGGPRFVRMTGITAVGRTPDGLVVAAHAPGAPESGPIVVTIREADTGPIRAGATVSVLSALGLVVLLLWPARRLTRRRAPLSS